MKMKRYLFGTAMAACLIGALLTTAAAEDPTGNITLTEGSYTDQNYTVSNAGTITVQGQVTLNGSGDAFTINADTQLVFEEGASLTLSGYTNGFVVKNATVISEDMNITATSQMDVFRLRTNGELSLSGSSTIIGSGGYRQPCPGSGERRGASHHFG